MPNSKQSLATTPPLTALTLIAPAKINIMLRIIGRRKDGYHQLVSLVGFAKFGDKLHFRPAKTDALIISGDGAETLLADTHDNLIIRARDRLRAYGLSVPPTEIHLEKQIPIGGGLGGGSSDAAAVLRGLLTLYKLSLPADDLHRLAQQLGADVPACLVPSWQIMSGIGDQLEAVTLAPSAAPKLYVMLANPNVQLSTKAVFSALKAPILNNPQLLAGQLLEGQQNCIADIKTKLGSNPDWPALIAMGNDLTDPAIKACPPIRRLLDDTSRHAEDMTSLVGYGMSGSGASCFALFRTEAAAHKLAETLRAAGYWAIASEIMK